MNKIKLIIADDHPFVRFGLVNYLQKNKSYVILSEVGDGNEALKLILDARPDIAILDIDMPGMNGIKICEHITNSKIETKVLFLTMHKELDLYNKAMQIGASGYILKENALHEIDSALSSINAGEKYIGKDIEALLVKSKNNILLDDELNKKLKLLTKTEKDVLLLIAKQIKTKDIADKLFVSEKTIKNHRHNIIKKLELPGDQNALLKFAIENEPFIGT